MKKRKGFTTIVLDNQTHQFTWSSDQKGDVALIIYRPCGTRLIIPSFVWGRVPNSKEYDARVAPTYRGKRKKCSCFGGFGKAEVRELYRKYLILTSTLE